MANAYLLENGTARFLLEDGSLLLQEGPRSFDLGQVTEADTALAITKVDPILRAIGLVSEADTALTIARRKIRTLGIVSEADTAQATGRVKTEILGTQDVKRSPVTNVSTGTTVTTTNAGGTDFQQVVVTGATNAITFENFSDATAAVAANILLNSAGTGYLLWSLTPANAVKTSMKFRRNSGNTVNVPVVAAYSAGSIAASVQLDSVVQVLKIFDAGGTLRATGAVTVPNLTWTRIEVDWVAHPVAGSVVARLYTSENATTPADTITATAINTLGPIDDVRFGQSGPVTTTITWRVRDLLALGVPMLVEADTLLAVSHPKGRTLGLVSETDSVLTVTRRKIEPPLGIVTETDTPLTATRVHRRALNRVTSATVGSISAPWVGTAVLGSVAGTAAFSADVDISGAQDGQVVFVGGLLEDTQTEPVHLPAGWLLVIEGSEGTSGAANAGSHSFVAWRLKQPGDSTFTFSWGTTGKYQLIPFSYPGVVTDSTAIVDVVTYSAATSGSSVIIGLTTINALNPWIVGLFGKRGTTAAMAFTPAGALTERADVCTTANRFIALELADTNTSVGNGAHNYTATVTGSTATHGGGIEMAIIPGKSVAAEFPLVTTRRKVKTLGLVSEADTALTATPVHERTLGTATETDTALTITATTSGTPPLGLATETDSVLALNRVKVKVLGIVSETDTALTITRVHERTLGLVSEADTVLTDTRVHTRTFGLVTEADAALAMARVKTKTLGIVTESDTPLADSRVKIKTLGVVTEADSALAITKVDPILHVLGTVTEADTALALTRVHQRTLGTVTETDSPLAIARVKVKVLGLVTEADTAQAMSRVKDRNLGPASEVDSALAATRRKIKALGTVTETDAALALTRVHERTLGTVTEADSALTMHRVKERTLGEPTETDTALTITKVDPILRVLGTVTEVDLLLTITSNGAHAVGLVTEVDSAQAMHRVKVKTLGLVSETDSPLALAHRKVKTLGEPTETDTALASTRRKTKTLGTTTEADTAGSMAHAKTHSVGPVTEVDSALHIARPFIAKTLGTVTESDSAPPMLRVKRVPLEVIAEADQAQALATLKTKSLGLLVEVDSVPLLVPQAPTHAHQLHAGITQERLATVLVNGHGLGAELAERQVIARVVTPRSIGVGRQGRLLVVTREDS